MQKITHSVDYSRVLGEIKTAAHDGKPAAQAQKLADLITKDAAFDGVNGGIAVSRFIRAVMVAGIPEVAKVSLASDPVVYTYYANVRRLTKIALVGNGKKTVRKAMTGVVRMIASVNRMKDVGDLEKLEKAVKARIDALKA